MTEVMREVQKKLRPRGVMWEECKANVSVEHRKNTRRWQDNNRTMKDDRPMDEVLQDYEE